MKMARSIVFIARKWNWLAPIRHIIKPVCIWVVTVKMALILWVSAYWEICFHVEHFICGLGHIWKRNIQAPVTHFKGKNFRNCFPSSVGWPSLCVNIYDFPFSVPYIIPSLPAHKSIQKYNKWQWRNLGNQVYFHGVNYIFYLAPHRGHIFPLAFLFLAKFVVYGIWQMRQKSVPDGCKYCATGGVVFYWLSSSFSWVCHCHRLIRGVCKGWWKYTKSRMI